MCSIIIQGFFLLKGPAFNHQTELQAKSTSNRTSDTLRPVIAGCHLSPVSTQEVAKVQHLPIFLKNAVNFLAVSVGFS